MPVSRNLSLPASIERKFKKRPEELHDLKHCFSMPGDIQSNNSSYTDNGASQTKDPASSPMYFHSLTGQDVPALKSNSISLNPVVRSLVSRPSLSHPCLSDRTSVSATSIFPHLFLGSQKDVADKAMLMENDITNVLNVSCNCARPEHLDDHHFYRIAINDNYQEQITPHLDEAVDFIEAARRRNERVLVHCLAGVSRSATVAIAYVMYYLHLSFDDAYRFVKDKRPTISPNFNFVGQLVEYESKLRERGHMNKPATNSLPDECTANYHAPGINVHVKDGPKVLMAPMIEITKPVSRPIKFETTVLIKPCIVTPSSASSSSSSSFCRRRKGPALEKLLFSRDASSTSPTRETNDFERLRHHNTPVPGGAGVVLDLHVSVPLSEQYCRRLGSDGVEDDGEDDEADHHFNPTIFTHKSNSLPRRKPGLSAGSKRCGSCAAPPALVTDDFKLADDLSLSFRSSTAPATPSVLCLGKNINAFHSPGPDGYSAHERLMPRDVEMTTPDDDDTSPPSPQRSRRQTDNAASLLLTAPGYVDEREAYNSTLSSPLPGKFVSRKTRSPKVLKKSFNLNLRPPYGGYQAFRSTKQVNLQAPIPFRNRNPDAVSMRPERSEQFAGGVHCESPNADGISSLTLHSPGVVKSDPLQIVGKNCLQPRDEPNLKNDAVVSSSSLDHLTHGAAREHPSTSKLDAREPFKLVGSTDLKPKWRHRQRSKENNSGSSGSSESASPSVINHCNNIEILSCS